MYEKPKVAVLTATLGRGAWIESIKSVLAQDYPDLEVVLVVDEPSLENSMLDQLVARHENLTVLRNDENVGLTRAMNIAAETATGDYLVRHDDDDISYPDRVSKLIQHMVTHNLDLAGSAALARNEGETSTWVQRPPLQDAEIKEALENRNCLIHPTMAINRQAFRKLGGYDETFRYAQDYALYLKAKRMGLKFGCLAEPLVERVYGASSITVEKRKTQMLYSFSAKVLHNAECGSLKRIPVILGKFLFSFLTPMKFRELRRRLLARKVPVG